MRPTVEQLVSRVAWNKQRQERHDWSDGEGDLEGHSIMMGPADHDTQSIASGTEIGTNTKLHMKEQLQ